MTHYPIRLHLTKVQIRKLGKGMAVQVKPHHIGKGHVTHLTKIQMNRMARNVKKGCGTRIKFDRKQHHVNAGKGFFDVLKDLGSAILPHALDLAHGAIKSKYGWGIVTGRGKGRRRVGHFHKKRRLVGKGGIFDFLKKAGLGALQSYGRPALGALLGKIKEKVPLGGLTDALGNAGIDALGSKFGFGLGLGGKHKRVVPGRVYPSGGSFRAMGRRGGSFAAIGRLGH